MSAPRSGYSAGQKLLHWMVAFLVIGLVSAGILMVNLGDGDLKNRIYELHKSFGLIALGFIAVRVGLRALHGAPPLEPGLPGWQRRAAHLSHYALYALLVIVPLLGWAGTSACCAPVQIFGALPLTLPIEGGMEAGKPILSIHKLLALSLAALVLLHIAAALHHHLVRRDGTLRRMLPGSSRVGEKVEMPDGAARR